VSLVNCEQTMNNIEAKRSLVSSPVLPRLMTDAEADVAERVVLDYQQSFLALQDLSQKIRQQLPVPKGLAFCLKVNVDLTQLC